MTGEPLFPYPQWCAGCNGECRDYTHALAHARAEPVPGLYKHYRTGDLYLVLGIARDSDDAAGELDVVYYNPVKNILWHRKLSKWLAPVEGSTEPRYRLISATKPMTMVGAFAITMEPLDGTLQITVRRDR